MSDIFDAPEKISQDELFIKMVVDAWDLHNKRVSDLLTRLSDEQLYAAVAPGRNRGIYLLGHLVAVTDGIAPLLGAGPKLYPALEDTFLRKPDNIDADMPSADTLKEYWKKVNERLSAYIKTMPPDDWFTAHTAVSKEDFAREPHRNKLNILINRTNHEAYHFGQMIFLEARKS